jgi:hypothetical protein
MWTLEHAGTSGSSAAPMPSAPPVAAEPAPPPLAPPPPVQQAEAEPEPQPAPAPAPQPTTQARLRTMFTGGGKCLDIVNGGKNNRLQMANCAEASGQYWMAK